MLSLWYKDQVGELVMGIIGKGVYEINCRVKFDRTYWSRKELEVPRES